MRVPVIRACATARLGTAVLLALSLAACSGPTEQPAALPLPDLPTIAVARDSGADGLSWDGVVQAVEQSVLSAQTSGRVLELAVDVDRRVARGALLLRLTAEEQKASADTANAQLRAAEAQLVDAASRYRRAGELVGRKLIAQDDFDRVRAAHDAAQAERDAAAARLAQARQQLGYTEVRAPYAGIIAVRHVEPGETVVPGQPLFTLYAPGALRLEVEVPQADADRIKAHPAASVMLPDGRESKATEVLVFPRADPQAHSTTVRVMLPALSPAPRPGQIAKVRFAASAGQGQIRLPEAAILRRGELVAAYVIDGESIVQRQLRVGDSRDGQVTVIAGLVPGEQVAADALGALAAQRALRERATRSHRD
jgi:RND family efflux transporter MFP subunit